MGSDALPGWNFYARFSDVKFPRLGCDLSLHIKRMFNKTNKKPTKGKTRIRKEKKKNSSPEKLKSPSVKLSSNY